MKILRLLIFFLILNTFILLGFLANQMTDNVVVSLVEHANLTRAIDGDTIDTTLGRVRMLGINTPEKNHAGYQEPKDYLKQFEGKEIQLEQITEDKDQYGRLLRYVFYNGVLVNNEILKNGWAHFYTYNEDKYTQELRKTEEQARSLKIGIWEKSQDECANCIYLAELNEIDPGEYIILGNKCSFGCDLNKWTVNDDSSSHEKKLSFSISAYSNYTISYGNQSIWNDDGDTLYLRDELGKLVIFYRY